MHNGDFDAFQEGASVEKLSFSGTRNDVVVDRTVLRGPGLASAVVHRVKSTDENS